MGVNVTKVSFTSLGDPREDGKHTRIGSRWDVKGRLRIYHRHGDKSLNGKPTTLTKRTSTCVSQPWWTLKCIGETHPKSVSDWPHSYDLHVKCEVRLRPSNVEGEGVTRKEPHEGNFFFFFFCERILRNKVSAGESRRLDSDELFINNLLIDLYRSGSLKRTVWQHDGV